MQRISATVNSLEREDAVQIERSNSAFEMLRRLETELEGMKAETNRISRLDDRLELVQAERTRHNERLNELTLEQGRMIETLDDQAERLSLIEVRMAGYQEDLRAVRDSILDDRDRISAHLHSLTELESDMRKRQIAALEKEIRDLRSRAINFAEE
jgi:chromosome segregation ATPase